jgi:phosphate transport system substrate-binding protein
LQLIRMVAAIGLLTTVAAVAAGSAIGAEISGAGATFPYPVYARWAEAYKKATGVVVNYQPVGSGEGIRQIQNNEVTFGASDMPLKQADLEAYGLVQFPTVIGGVVPVVNVEGIKPGELTIDGPTLAKIFLGEIKSWNDAALRRLNPTVKLPSQGIAVVHRSDGSGTTFVFTDYLSKMSADWRSKVGSITSVDWPVGVGARGNEGVAASVARVRGSIGYVEYAYAKHNKLSSTKLMNKDGNAVAPTLEAFTTAARRANWEGTPGFGVILTNEAGADAWPMTSATFVLIHKQPSDALAAGEALKFFNWAYTKGGKLAEGLDYVPMPEKSSARFTSSGYPRSRMPPASRFSRSRIDGGLSIFRPRHVLARRGAQAEPIERHGRTCSGSSWPGLSRPSTSWSSTAERRGRPRRKTWMPAPSAGMTE